jgi:hypothetical protein
MVKEEVAPRDEQHLIFAPRDEQHSIFSPNGNAPRDWSGRHDPHQKVY